MLFRSDTVAGLSAAGLVLLAALDGCAQAVKAMDKHNHTTLRDKKRFSTMQKHHQGIRCPDYHVGNDYPVPLAGT